VVDETKSITHDFSALLKIIIYNGLGLFIVDIFFPYITSRVLNVSATYLGLIYSLILFGNILSSPLIGVLSDKLSKRKLVATGSVGRGIAYLLLYIGIITRSLQIYMLGSFTLGFLTGFFWIPLNALISQKSHKHHRSAAFGKRDLALGIGQLIGGLSGLALFSLGLSFYPENNALIFICLPIYGAMNMYAGTLFLRKIDENVHYQYAPNEKILLNNGNGATPTASLPVNSSVSLKMFRIGVFIFLLAFLVSAINGSLAKPFYQLYILAKLTDDPTLAIIAYVPAGIVAVALAPKLGKTMDKFNPLVGVSLLSFFGAMVTWLLISTASIWIFMVLLIIDMAINNAANLLLENMFSRISQKHRGKTFGARSMAANIGGMIGPIAGGLLFDYYGPSFPFIVSIFIELSLIVFFFIALRLVLPGLEEK
jgi:MFS family permease